MPSRATAESEAREVERYRPSLASLNQMPENPCCRSTDSRLKLDCACPELPDRLPLRLFEVVANVHCMARSFHVREILQSFNYKHQLLATEIAGPVRRSDRRSRGTELQTAKQKGIGVLSQWA